MDNATGGAQMRHLALRGQAMAVSTGDIRTATAPAQALPLSYAGRLGLTWQRLALAIVLAVSAALEFIGLGDEGYANSYYAAGVKSMLTSWHNFFYLSYDSGGFVTIDKPPLGLWIEAASAKLFGFSGLSLLVPEALAGVLSVALLYRLVSRAFDPVAGLLAALLLALTPISAVIDRNNTIDSLLILTLLLGAWAVSAATERGSLRLLLLSAVVLGLGFNIKMLQAYLVLPAFTLVYLLGAPLRFRIRLVHLVIAGIVLLGVSFCWIAAVDLTPAAQRPFVSDSGTNSELSLVLGYNGLGRLTQALFPGVRYLHLFGETIDLSIVPGSSPGIGDPGVLRLIRPAVGGQASWFLLPALCGLLALMPRRRPTLPLTRQGQSIVLWGGWLLAAALFFSTARFFHLYYLVMLGPPIAALAGSGIRAIWHEYRFGTAQRGWKTWRAWLLPATLLGTAAIQVRLLDGYPDGGVLPTLLLIGGALAVGAVLVAPLLRIELFVTPEFTLRTTPRSALIAVGMLICGLCAAPATWAVTAIAAGQGGAWLPQAGPTTAFGGRGAFGPGPGGFRRGRAAGAFPFAGTPGAAPPAAGQGGVTPGAGSPLSNGGTRRGRFRFSGGVPAFAFGGGGGGAMTFAGDQIPMLNTALLRYLEANRGTARYLVATPTATYASLFMLQTTQPAMALGGYQGWDRILTLAQLQQVVARGVVRFFYLSGGTTGAGQFSFPGRSQSNAGAQNLAATNDDLTRWVQSACSVVPAATWQSTKTTAVTAGRDGLQLYDCAHPTKTVSKQLR